MKAAIIISHGEMRTLPFRELLKPLREKCVALKVVTGYGFDNTDTRISDIYGFNFKFSLHSTKPKIGSPLYKQYMKMFPDKVRGKTIRTENIFNLSVWDVTGGRAVFSTTFWIDDFKEPIPVEVRKGYESAMDDFRKGSLKCSDCGKPTEANTHNRYFAGSYCDDCWLGRTGKHKDGGGWQKVEANESYN